MEQKKGHITDIIFVLSLFCVFTVMALFVVILGVNVYKGVSASMDENYNARTSVSYLTEKIRQNDVPGGVDIREMDGGDALVLTHKGGQMPFEYETWIFAADGELREVMVVKGTQVEAGFGQAIMPIREMRLDEVEGGLIRVTVTDGQGHSVDCTVRAVSVGN